jgi:Tfp pilus assembly protein PilF
MKKFFAASGSEFGFRYRKSTVLRVVGISLLGVLLFWACASAPPQKLKDLDSGVLPSAWENLWKNNYLLAESSFKEALAARPKDPEASRGMALVLHAKGQDAEAASYALDSIESDYSSPFVPSVQSFALEMIPDGKKTVERLKQLADKELAKDAPAQVKRLGNHFLTEYYRFLSADAAKMRAAADGLGALASWKIIGPFQDVSSSGMEKDYIGETKQEDWGAGSFQAKDGRKLSWTSPDKFSPDAYIRPESYLGYESWGSVFYALGEVKTGKEGDFRLFLERRGAAKLWLDGSLVAADGSERLAGEYESGIVHLQAGAHKVLVKLASEWLVAGFRLSLVREAPAPVEASKAASLLADLRGVTSGDSSLDLASMVAEKASGGSPDSSYWLARGLYDCGYYLAALDEIAVARKGPAARSALFDQVESSCLAALGRKNEARTALIRSQDDKVYFAPAIDALVNEHIGEHRFLEATLLLLDASSRLGDWRQGSLDALALALASSNDVYAKADEYRTKFPDSPDGAVLLAQKGLNFGFDLKSLAAEIRDKGRPYEADRLLLNYAIKNGNLSDVLSLGGARAELSPDNATLRCQLQDAAGRAGKLTLDEAIKQARALCLSFPGSTDLAILASSLAEVKVVYAQKDASQKKAGDVAESPDQKAAKDQYIESLRSLLWLHPSNFEYRKQLRTALKLPDLDKTETLTSVESAIQDYEKARKAKAAPESDAEIVLDSSSTNFFGDGASRFYKLLILKPLSQRGVEAETSQRLASGSGVEVSQAFVLKADGTRVQARVGASSVSFPGLAQGDYLVLRYQGNNYQSGALAKQFWASQAFQFAYPAYSVTAEFVYPQGADPRVEYRNLGSLDIARRNDKAEEGMMRTTLSASEVPAAPAGRLSPDARDTALWVDLSSLRSWTPISNWYRDLFYGRTLPSDTVAATAKKLTEGLSDKRSKMAKLFNFVANTVIYEDTSFMYSAFVPQRAESVLEDRFGDCKDKCALLVGLLGASGIDAEVALSAPDYRGSTPYLPSIRFSHIVVIVPDPAGDLILDPTAAYSTFPRLPEDLQGTWYLPIHKDPSAKTELSRIPFVTAAAPTSIFLQVSLGDGSRPKVQGQAVMGGEFTYALRYSYAPASPERRRDLVASLLASVLPGFELSAYTAKGLEGGVENQDPSLDFEGLLPPVAADGADSALPLPWATSLPASLQSFALKGSDSLKVDYPAFAAPMKEIIVLKLPQGTDVARLPADADFRFGSAYATFHYSRTGSTIVCARELYLPYMVVAEADREAFAAFVAQAAAKGREAIVVRPLVGNK